MDIVGTSSSRASDQTAPAVNEQIRRNMEMRVHGYAAQPHALLSKRLGELEYEWDTERCLQTGASFFTMFGTTLGATVSRKWLVLPGVVMGFFLQHSVQGWCPPLVAFRKLGVRTPDEINEERYALKALRGDFNAVLPSAETAGTTDPAAVLGEGQVQSKKELPNALATPTFRRVTANTAPEVNARIQREMEQRVHFFGTQGPEAIRERVAALDQEWDIERVIETEAPLMALTGIALGTTVNRKWLALPGFVGGMVFLHAVQGWYPLLPLFRRMGLRTREEIGQEKMALKALRGDFTQTTEQTDAKARAEAALRAVRL